jgi:hypothetical protein
MDTPPTRTIILRELARGGGWTFSWNNNSIDSICNLKLRPFSTKEDAEEAARTFIGQQKAPHEWIIKNPC